MLPTIIMLTITALTSKTLKDDSWIVATRANETSANDVMRGTCWRHHNNIARLFHHEFSRNVAAEKQGRLAVYVKTPQNVTISAFGLTRADTITETDRCNYSPSRNVDNYLSVRVYSRGRAAEWMYRQWLEHVFVLSNSVQSCYGCRGWIQEFFSFLVGLDRARKAIIKAPKGRGAEGYVRLCIRIACYCTSFDEIRATV